MRKIVAIMHVSLDGFTSDEFGSISWIKMEEEVFRFVEPYIDLATTGVYGPITFQMMESYWPNVLKDPNAVGHQRHHSQWYAKAEKVIFSQTVDTISATGTYLVSFDLVGEVGRLKESDGGDIVILGSPRLVHSFAELGLIDEYVLTISPVALGAGIPLFKPGCGRKDFEVVSAVTFSVGAVGLHLRKK